MRILSVLSRCRRRNISTADRVSISGLSLWSVTRSNLTPPPKTRQVALAGMPHRSFRPIYDFDPIAVASKYVGCRNRTIRSPRTAGPDNVVPHHCRILTLRTVRFGSTRCPKLYTRCDSGHLFSVWRLLVCRAWREDRGSHHRATPLPAGFRGSPPKASALSRATAMLCRHPWRFFATRGGIIAF